MIGPGSDKNGKGKGERYLEKEDIRPAEEKKNREGKGGKYLDGISLKIVKDIEKSQFRSRDFCQF